MTVEIGEELLIGEQGQEESFEVLYTFEWKGENYLVVGLTKDLDEESDDPTVTAFRYSEEEDGTIVYEEIESEEEWNEVESRFMAYQDELENETYSG
ncbi:DUF1292 domain-containing protein [Bacillus spongiae]|uniref:DUF1292 domain-containing protein n=1 Tax=Bacillus spongiae TaxID=2683610 RepID=A0ABU8HHU7_9BACI